MVLDALRTASRRLAVHVEDLRIADYRRSRSRDARLPSEASIRSAFGSWQRAREQAARAAPERRF
jgi:hypothetical protein